MKFKILIDFKDILQNMLIIIMAYLFDRLYFFIISTDKFKFFFENILKNK